MPRVLGLSILLLASACLSAQTHETRVSALLDVLVSPQTPEGTWNKAEQELKGLPLQLSLRGLLPEVARGMPEGPIWNCSSPKWDRNAGERWARYCVSSHFWCALICRQSSAPVLLSLLKESPATNRRLVLLSALTYHSWTDEAEPLIVAMFRDTKADPELRAGAAQCLLHRKGAKYYEEVLNIAVTSPWSFRRLLFHSLTFNRPPGRDARVAELGFGLLPVALENENLLEPGFRVAVSLGHYLDQKFAPEEGSFGLPGFYRNTVDNALNWWSKNRPSNIQR